MQGQFQIGASRQAVWEALNDPAILQQCIPGCQSIEQVDEQKMRAVVVASIGPVKAKFNANLSLENLNPPESYTLAGDSKAGAAGFGRGSADVTLSEHDGGTRLAYTASFSVGGKLAQIGSRLVEGATRKIADDFFSNFAAALAPDELDENIEPEVTAPAITRRTWIGVGAAVAVLLIWWFLLR